MSLEQAPSLPVPPTTTEIRQRIADHERATEALLEDLQRLFDTHAHLWARMERVADRVTLLTERRTVIQVIEDFLAGERPRAEKHRLLCRTGKALASEAESIHFLLKDWGYRQTDFRTQVHYDDIKALNLLDISGDPQAEEFGQRTTGAISQLRFAQRWIEALSLPGRRVVVFDEELQES